MAKDYNDLFAATSLGLPPFRRWYRFGLRSPVVLWKRNRASRWRFRFRMARQRALRGYGDDDLWNLNHSTARLIVAGARAIREWEHGYPSELTWEQWEDILRRIEVGFQAWIDEDGWFHEKPEAEASYKDALALFAEWHGGLWD